jgi:hypothetical protein
MRPANHQEERMMAKLAQYMKARANFEKVQWLITEEDLSEYFNKGVRNFFGVEIDDNGNLIEDQQQPSFFKSYKSSSVN